MRRRRVLFVGEATSLAHATRPLVLASALDPDQWEIHIAMSDRMESLVDKSRFEFWPIETRSPEEFAATVRTPKSILPFRLLRSQVRQDLELIDAISPDLIVHDFRMSLGISARVALVPVMTITNACWSPYYRGPVPVPDVQGLGFLPESLSKRLFDAVRGPAFRRQAGPYNRLRKYLGLGPVADLCAMHTDADHVLYADTPSFVNLDNLPGTHSFLGPTLWEPKAVRPIWWDDVKPDEPWVYLTLGTSGSIGNVSAIVAQLTALGLRVMVATGNRAKLAQVPPGVRVAPYLPGIQASRKAAVVVCNGGSGTLYQALSAGKPVLALASNLDQQLHGAALERSGAGIHLASRSATPEQVTMSVAKLLSRPSYRKEAQRQAAACEDMDAGARFSKLASDFMDSIDGRRHPELTGDSRAPRHSGFIESRSGAKTSPVFQGRS